MNDLEFKKNKIRLYWERQRDNARCPLARVEFNRRVDSMRKDLPAEVIEEMYQEVLKQEEKESGEENVRGTS